MGLETAALIGTVGSQLYGAYNQNRTNAANLRAQQARQAQVTGMVTPYLTPAGTANPIAGQIQDFLKNGIYGTAGPTPVGTEGFNPGQDALLQMMRSSPSYQANNTLDSTLSRLMTGGGFDTTDQFNTLGALSEQDLNQQVSRLRGGAGSLGQRFGTASQGAEGLLRSTALTNLAAQRAQIAQSAYNQNQQTQLAAGAQAGSQNQFMNNFILQGLAQRANAAQAAGGLFNQGRQITGQEQQFNVGQQQQHNQFLNNFILQGLMGAGGLQQGSNAQNAQLLGLLAGQPVPQGQPSAMPGAVGDVSQMALLWPFLQSILNRPGGAGAGAGGNLTPATPSYVPNVQPWTPPPMNWSLS